MGATGTDSSNSTGSTFHFGVGLAYVNGIHDVSDKLEKNLGVSTNFVWPVGVLIRPEWELSHNVAFSFVAGPATFISIERSYSGASSYSNTEYDFNIPLGADVRYSFPASGKGRPYVRAGLRYNWAGADSFDSGSVGVAGAVGFAFKEASHYGWGAEIGYDTSTMKVMNDKVTPTGLSIAVLFTF